MLSICFLSILANSVQPLKSIKSQPETTAAIYQPEKNTNLVHDLEYLLPIKFHQIWFCKLGLFVFSISFTGYFRDVEKHLVDRITTFYKNFSVTYMTYKLNMNMHILSKMNIT